MKPGDLLRQLADMIDAAQQEDYALEEPNSEEMGIEEPSSGLDQAPDDLFLPPLQMKLELLKKATGVENVYDEENEEETVANSYDELDAIKRNAGINVVAIDALGDNDPLEG